MISLGVAALSFVVGQLVKRFLGYRCIIQRAAVPVVVLLLGLLNKNGFCS